MMSKQDKVIFSDNAESLLSDADSVEMQQEKTVKEITVSDDVTSDTIDKAPSKKVPPIMIIAGIVCLASLLSIGYLFSQWNVNAQKLQDVTQQVEALRSAQTDTADTSDHSAQSGDSHQEVLEKDDPMSEIERALKEDLPISDITVMRAGLLNETFVYVEFLPFVEGDSFIPEAAEGYALFGDAYGTIVAQEPWEYISGNKSVDVSTMDKSATQVAILIFSMVDANGKTWGHRNVLESGLTSERIMDAAPSFVVAADQVIPGGTKFTGTSPDWR